MFSDLITICQNTCSWKMENVNQDELILKQHEAVQKDIADNTKLVSEILSLQSLEAEFQSDEVFKAKILKLGQKYSRMRRVRPDGNCFFRAVGYRLFEVFIFHYCQVRSPKVQSPKVKTKRTWADTKTTWATTTTDPPHDQVDIKMKDLG